MRAKYILKQAKISLVAPSFGCSFTPYKDQLIASIENLKKKGYEIVEGKNIYKNWGLAASGPRSRAKEFMDAYASDADAIFSVGGGEIMCEILPYINFEKIKKLPPKWFMGYSDNTFLTYTLTTMCDIETIYGPHAPKFFEEEFTYAQKDALRMLRGERVFSDYGRYTSRHIKTEDPLEIAELDAKTEIIAVNYQEEFEGVLLGGCLDCLDILCGTKYDKTKEYIKSKKEGIIFYLENYDLNSLDIRRTLFKFKEAGWFDNVKGFLIGRSHNDEKYFGVKPVESYIKMLKEYHVPILLDVDLGHVGPSVPLRNGALCKIKYKDNSLTFEYRD